MNILENVFANIQNLYKNPVLYTSVILSVLLVVFVLCCYEFLIYRFVSHRAFYNKSFNICICVIPFFISTIILCLQSSIVITLGTIGALAIIRFRTAIKDPVDMLYLLWSVHIGIVCGCQLYEVAILTSLAVTIVLLFMENFSFHTRPLLLVFSCEDGAEKEIMQTIQEFTRKYKVKNRTCTPQGLNYVIELSSKNPDRLSEILRDTGVKKFSIIEYDSDDIL